MESLTQGTRREPRPTLRTIADRAGLAVTTVSRALNDAPDIGQETKRRVREIAAEIGYRPDRAGLRLRTGRTNVISLVLPTDDDFINHTARLASSVAMGLRGTPYHLIVTPYFSREDPMAPIRYLVETRSADGVILNQTEPADPRVSYLLDHGIAVATHGRTDLAARHAFCDFDNRSLVRLCLEAFRRRGRRRALMVAPPAEQNYGVEMRRGADEAAASTGLGCEVLEGVTSHARGLDIETALLRRLGDGPPIDAVISASTTGCIAVVAALEKAGLTVGQDVDVAAKEAVPFLKVFRPAIITFSEDVSEAGDFLARAIVHRLARPDEPPMHCLQPARGSESD